MSEERKEGVIIFIHKTGDKMKSENYRGITMLNTCYKTFSTVLLENLEAYTEEGTISVSHNIFFV